MQIFKLFYILIFVTHYYACGLTYISQKIEQQGNESSLLSSALGLEKSIINQYISSMFLCIFALTSVNITLFESSNKCEKIYLSILAIM